MSSRPESGPRAGIDFFSYGALPVPQVSREEAERIAVAQFGLTARALPLGSQQDSNFLLVEADGSGAAPGDSGGAALGAAGSAVLGAAGSAVLGVLKIANPATVATGVDLWLSRPAELTAPWAGEIIGSAPDQLVFTGAGLALTVCWRTSQVRRTGG